MEIRLSGNGSSFHRSNLPSPLPLHPSSSSSISSSSSFFYYFYPSLLIFFRSPFLDLCRLESSAFAFSARGKSGYEAKLLDLYRDSLFAYKYIPDGNRPLWLAPGALHDFRVILLASMLHKFSSVCFFDCFFLLHFELHLDFPSGDLHQQRENNSSAREFLFSWLPIQCTIRVTLSCLH